jgi:hypothetical protein
LTLLALLALPAVAASFLPRPPTPRVNGSFSTRIDPARPYVSLQWDASEIAGAVAIDYEISARPFADRNPEELSQEPLRQGHLLGASGIERINLEGLGEGQYYLRYQAVSVSGRPVSLASDPVRLVVVGGVSLPPRSTAPSTPVPSSPPGPSPAGPSPGTLDPPRASLALGQSLTFHADPALGSPLSWRVRGGDPYGTVDGSGTYRAPAEMPGGPSALSGVTAVEAVYADGTVAVGEILLTRPRRLFLIEAQGPASVRPGGTVQLRARLEGWPAGPVQWRVVGEGAGSVDSGGLYHAPARLDRARRIEVRARLPQCPEAGEASTWVEVVP